jgi:hypothetical protein
MIMSNRGPPTCGVPIGEQCSSTGVPDDHEQSGTVLAGRTRIAWTNAAEAVTESYLPSAGTDDQQRRGFDCRGGCCQACRLPPRADTAPFAC